MAHSSSRSSSSIHSINYTPQQFLTYLQSIKTFDNFDQSTIILQSQAPNNESSLNIRITEHHHITLHAFLSDCIIISQIHNNDDFKSILNNQTSTSIIPINNILPLSSNKPFLLSFYNQFLHFLSLLTQMFDENIVSTKLRIRGPYLLMINQPSLITLCTFLLSQIIIIQSNMHLYSNSDVAKYEMTLKEMKNLRYIINFIKNLLQFELYTADFLSFDMISNMILFDQNEQIKKWSQALSKLFAVILMIKLPTNSLGVLQKFSRDKLVLLENKAMKTTKAFRGFVITFIRFLVIHYQNRIMENNNFNHLDVIMHQLFDKQKLKYNGDIIDDLWCFTKLEKEFKIEYEMKGKYQSSAFLKGKSITNNTVMDMDVDDIEMVARQQKKSKRNDINFDMIDKHEFIKQECFLLIVDKILTFCLDFNTFYEIININVHSYDSMMQVLNVILLHFVTTEKWWHLSHIMGIFNDLFQNEGIFKRFLHDYNNKNAVALNIKYGIYAFMIWICYIHQITPKPVITFFDDNVVFDEAKRKEKTFETLSSIQERVTELCLSEAVLIKILITTDEWLVTDIVSNFTHIRDQYVVVKLLTILLRDIDFLTDSNVLHYDENYKARFLEIFYQFKHKILSHGNKQIESSLDSKPDEMLLPDTNIRKPVIKSKIVFRKQRVSKLTKIRTKKKAMNKQHIASDKAVAENDDDNQLIFKHFTAESMEIVECVVNNNKHLLYQFVTGSKSPSASKATSTSTSVSSSNAKNKQPPTCTAAVSVSNRMPMPAPPVFEPYETTADAEAVQNNNELSLDLGLLSSTLSSIQTALDVPAVGAAEAKNKRLHNNNVDDGDFDFDYQRISYSRRHPMSQQYDNSNNNYAYSGMYGQTAPAQMDNNYNPPPKKKRKTSNNMNDEDGINSNQLNNLLAYLCEDKGDKEKEKKVSPRYPKPKAPTMQELNTDGNDDSNWTNVVNYNLNRH